MSLFEEASETEAAALRILKNTFGYTDFVGRQREVITHVIEGGDALALMPTGGGKSLCYQIPALVREGVTVVVSPLIALMKDQVDSLQQNDVRAAFLNSSQTAKQAAAVEKQVAKGELDLLYIAPERLMTERGLQTIQQGRVALFAIDEAHCVSQWGHDFRPEYLKLGQLKDVFTDTPMLALTATADARTRQEIIDKLRLHDGKTFVASFDRPNIKFSIALREKPRQKLLDFYEQHHRGHSGIVYCLSRRKTEETAEFLEKQGLHAIPYHAGMDQKTRQRHQDRFIHEEGVIIVATIAFGMGINKPDVRFVVHLDMPKSIEGYYQEVGRAGRDGLPANALLLYGLRDAIMLRQMIEDGNAPEHIRRIQQQKMEALQAFCVSTNCRRQSLLEYFGEEFAPPCNNCDNCLEPPQMWDGALAAKKFLSCVYRTGERFGAGHIVDVLLGKDTAKIEKLAHNKLSTFGIGEELKDKEWRAVARQLAGDGILSANEHGGLTLTDEAWKIMRGERGISFRVEQTRVGSVKKSVERKPQPIVDLDERQMVVFEALRELRNKLAQQQKVPAYAIFQNKTLVEMARTHPVTAEDMRQISGVGDAKIERYATKFIKVLREL
ncbi:MAG: DNA helicase RecQ [Gammaproteobacteria bacterium WSBS_2016_MAG_OTU1]